MTLANIGAICNSESETLYMAWHRCIICAICPCMHVFEHNKIYVAVKAISIVTSATNPAKSGSPKLAIHPSIMCAASHGLW